MNISKLTRILALCVVATSISENVNAGDREWATAGKILTGVAAGVILADAIHDQHHHTPTMHTYHGGYPISNVRRSRVVVRREIVTPPTLVTTRSVTVTQPVVVRERFYRSGQIVEKRIIRQSQPVTIIRRTQPVSCVSSPTVVKRIYRTRPERVIVYRN